MDRLHYTEAWIKFGTPSEIVAQLLKRATANHHSGDSPTATQRI